MNAFSYPFSQGRSLGAQRGLETNVLKDTNAQQQKRNTGIWSPKWWPISIQPLVVNNERLCEKASEKHSEVFASNYLTSYLIQKVTKAFISTSFICYWKEAYIHTARCLSIGKTPNTQKLTIIFYGHLCFVDAVLLVLKKIDRTTAGHNLVSQDHSVDYSQIYKCSNRLVNATTEHFLMFPDIMRGKKDEVLQLWQNAGS